MTGDDRVRFCDHCQLNVYNISELSRIEAEKLIASTEGRLCARLFRRADGTVLTQDCPVGLRALRMRVSKRAAAILAAIVSLSSAAVGQQSATRNAKTSCTPQVRITRTAPNSDAPATAISGTVLDPNGAVIPEAKVRLINEDSNQTKTVKANEAGRFEFAPLSAGSYTITIESASFKSLKVTHVIFKKDKPLNLDIILEPAGEQLIGVVAISDLIDTPPGTTIITEKMIQSLPH